MLRFMEVVTSGSITAGSTCYTSQAPLYGRDPTTSRPHEITSHSYTIRLDQGEHDLRLDIRATRPILHSNIKGGKTTTPLISDPLSGSTILDTCILYKCQPVTASYISSGRIVLGNHCLHWCCVYTHDLQCRATGKLLVLFTDTPPLSYASL
jgi:hypothetical protein